MARLYDRIVAGCEVDGQEDGGTELRRCLAGATVFGIDNVQQYFWDQKGSIPDDPNSWTLADFPNIAPPFDVAWFDFRVTGFRGPRIDVGVLVGAARARDDAEMWMPSNNERVWLPQGAWFIGATVFIVEERRGTPICVGAWKYYANPDGSPGKDAQGRPFVVGSCGGEYRERHRSRTDEEMRFITRNNCRLFVYPTLLATSFMHCKNVERRPVDQPAKLSKKWAKKHGRPLVRYHVLDIDPMRKVLDTEGGAGENGLKKALHICRGHFATYTEDAPLFGRHVGTFWKPQHVRGSAKNGAVVKDYRVHAP